MNERMDGKGIASGNKVQEHMQTFSVQNSKKKFYGIFEVNGTLGTYIYCSSK